MLARQCARISSDCSSGTVKKCQLPLSPVQSQSGPVTVITSFEPTMDAAVIDGLGEILPVHVGEPEVVLDAPQLGWNAAERPPGLVAEIHAEDRMLRIGQCLCVRDKQD